MHFIESKLLQILFSGTKFLNYNYEKNNNSCLLISTQTKRQIHFFFILLFIVKDDYEGSYPLLWIGLPNHRSTIWSTIAGLQGIFTSKHAGKLKDIKKMDNNATYKAYTYQ